MMQFTPNQPYKKCKREKYFRRMYISNLIKELSWAILPQSWQIFTLFYVDAICKPKQLAQADPIY